MPNVSKEQRRAQINALDAIVDLNSSAWSRYSGPFRKLSKDRTKNDDLAVHFNILEDSSFPRTVSFNYMGGTHEEDEGKLRTRLAPVEYDSRCRRPMLICVDTAIKARKYYSLALIYNLKSDQ